MPGGCNRLSERAVGSLFQRELWGLLVPAEENSRPLLGQGEMVSESYPGFFL